MSVDVETVDDEDVDAPSYEQLGYFAELLRRENPRERLKGSVGVALKELGEIKRRLATGDLSPHQRAQIGRRLWALNNGSLGLGEKIFRAKHRPRGAASGEKLDLDYQLIARANELKAVKGSLGAALRTCVEDARKRGLLLEHSEIETHIKRLRRRIARSKSVTLTS